MLVKNTLKSVMQQMKKTLQKHIWCDFANVILWEIHKNFKSSVIFLSPLHTAWAGMLRFLLYLTILCKRSESEMECHFISPLSWNARQSQSWNWCLCKRDMPALQDRSVPDFTLEFFFLRLVWIQAFPSTASEVFATFCLKSLPTSL